MTALEKYLQSRQAAKNFRRGKRIVHLKNGDYIVITRRPS